jgi:hypothetical protein
MQGRSASGSSGASVGMTREEKVKVVLDDILEKLPENFDIQGVVEYVSSLPLFSSSHLCTDALRRRGHLAMLSCKSAFT